MDHLEHEQLKESITTLTHGEHLEWRTDALWQIDDIRDAPAFLASIASVLPANTSLYFEGVDIAFEAAALYEKFRASEAGPVSADTLSPRPTQYHTRNDPEFLSELARLTAALPQGKVFQHMKAYQPDRLVLWFHDAFDGDPLHLCGCLPEKNIAALATSLGKPYTRVEVPDPKRGKEQMRLLLAFLESQQSGRPPGDSWWRRLLRFGR